jgi:Fe-S-cluster containining protein
MDLAGLTPRREQINPELAGKVKDLVAGTLNLSRTEAAVLSLAAQAVNLADQLIDYFESANPLPQAIACQEGCTSCCYNQVEVTPLEALLISHHLAENLSPKDRKDLLERVNRALTLKANKSKRKIARQRRRLPCPLLQDGRCLAYQVRPLVCRAMHAFDPAACRQELQRGSLAATEFYAHRYEFVWSISAGLQQGCRQIGCQSGVMDLDRALRDYFARENAVEMWLAGEPTFSGPSDRS